MTIKPKTLLQHLTVTDLINYLLVLFSFTFPLSSKKSTIVILLLTILWFIEGNWKKKFKILIGSKPFLLYFAFIIFIGLSLIWSSTVYGGFDKHYPMNGLVAYIKMYLQYFMLVPIMMTSMKVTYIKYVISAFLSAMFISELASWGLYLGWIDIKGRISGDPSPFMHHSLYSVFLAVTIFILLAEFEKAKSVLLKISMLVFLVSALVNLFLNGGRLGQLAFFIALMVYIFMKFRVTFKSIVLALATVSMIFAIAYQVSPIFQKRVNQSIHSLEKISQGNFHSSWGSRVYALIIAKDIVLENPVLGVGIGAAKVEFIKRTKEYPHGGLVKGFWHLHNQYMQILVETGILGLVLFILFIYSLFQISVEKNFYILLCSILVTYLVGFIGEPLFWNRQSFLLFNFIIGLFLLLDVAGKKEKGKIDK